MESPKIIYLQKEEVEYLEEDAYDEYEEVTWCQDRIHDTDIKYIRADLVENKNHLLNLLAVIHRDGGQYVGEYGLDKAVEDAKQIVTDAVVR